ncbi:MAG TPA: PEP-CTERM sorting domain-containing protein [Gemmataceae bacterium]|nr:PEP-CTERM sorting domain-containing protein [Gemmataceae bacterium]
MTRAIALCLAAVSLLSAGSAAHADQITYSISSSYPSIFFSSGTLGGINVAGSGTLTTGTPITIPNSVTAFSFASPLLPQGLSNVPVNLTLNDQTTGQSQTLSLGSISGTMSILGSSLSFTPSAEPMSATFGSSSYNITSSGISFTSGVLVTTGTLSFSVTDPPAGTGTISSVGGNAPEPSSLLLAGIGVPLLGVFLRRRRA